MKRTIALIACALLALTACSTTDPKADILNNVRAAAITSGLTEVQADCVVDGLAKLTVEQLQSIADDTADAETTQSYTFVAAQCLLSE